MSERQVALFIATATGLEVVPAFCTGELAIHSWIATDEQEDDEEFWAITHCSSGYKVFDFYTKQAALECAIELEQLDWSCVQMVEGKPVVKADRGWLQQCFAILKRNKTKHTSPHYLPEKFPANAGFEAPDREVQR